MKAIYKRELGTYFHSMTGSVCTAFLLAAVGLYFMVYNLYQGAPSFANALVSALYLFIVVIPLLTMRSMAEDRRNKTDQLLLTAPVSVTGVVLGKFFAMVTVFAVPWALCCLCPLIMKLASGSDGVVYFRSDYATLLAFLLLGCLYLSIGLLISSLTESQIIAAVSTVGVLVLLYLWDGLLSFLPTTASGNLVGMVVVVLLVALLLYSLTSSAVIGGAGGCRRHCSPGSVLPGQLRAVCQPPAQRAGGLFPEHGPHQFCHRLCLRRRRTGALPVPDLPDAVFDRPDDSETALELRRCPDEQE